MIISHDHSIWQSNLYGKRIELKRNCLKVNKFPDSKSQISKHCKYGIVTNQLHHYTVTCTKSAYLLDADVNLYSAYADKGYELSTMQQHFNKFFRYNRAAQFLQAADIHEKYLQRQTLAACCLQHYYQF